MAQNGQNGPEWPKRPRITQNGPKSPKLPKWPRMAQMAQNGQNGPELPKMADLVQTCPEQSKWPKMAQKDILTISAGKFRKKLFLGTPCIRLLSKPTQISLYTKPRPAYGRQGLAWWIVGRVQFLWSHFSRLALRLECQKGAVRNCYSQSAKRVQSKTVTHSLPRECGPKLFPTACQEGAVQNCYSRGAPNNLLYL